MAKELTRIIGNESASEGQDYGMAEATTILRGCQRKKRHTKRLRLFEEMTKVQRQRAARPVNPFDPRRGKLYNRELNDHDKKSLEYAMLTVKEWEDFRIQNPQTARRNMTFTELQRVLDDFDADRRTVHPGGQMAEVDGAITMTAAGPLQTKQRRDRLQLMQEREDERRAPGGRDWEKELDQRDQDQERKGRTTRSGAREAAQGLWKKPTGRGQGQEEEAEA